MPTASSTADAERLSAADRRAALLDVAKGIVLADGPDAVTIGTVADRAGVTRALVYKHFDNRGDVLVEVYRREAAALDSAMRAAVLAAGPGLEAKLRALATTVVDSADRYGGFFRLLRAASGSGSARSDRRSWDRRTVRYFAELARAETGLDERTAIDATALLLTPLQTLRAQALARPGRRDEYVDIYVDLVIGGFERLARRRGA